MSPRKARGPKSGRWAWWPGVVMLVVGVALAFGAFAVYAFAGLSSAMDAKILTTPGVVSAYCSPGECIVYQLNRHGAIPAGFNVAEPSPTLKSTDVLVTGPDGRRVATSSIDGQSVTYNATGMSSPELFTAAVSIAADRPGTYRVSVPHVHTQIYVGRLVYGSTRERLLILAGAVLALAGLVVLIVSLLHNLRVRHDLETLARSPAPPGWFPDATAPGTWRWWDGVQWTDAVSAQASHSQHP